jgi:AcrR family transcriptional regulator
MTGRRMNREERRADFLAAAASIVREHGVAAVTMERTSQVAAVNRALIYRFFDNRDDLLVQLAQHETARLDEAQNVAMQAADSLLAKIQALAETYLHLVVAGDMDVADELSRPLGGEGPLAEWQEHRNRVSVFFIAQMIVDEHPAVPHHRAVVLGSVLGAGVQGILGLARAGVDTVLLVEDFTRACQGAIDALVADVEVQELAPLR